MKTFLIAVFSLFSLVLKAQDFTLVTYNVENLFDADGISQYDDYQVADKSGRPQYTPAQLLVKLKNVVEVMKKYNSGNGPDIIALVEIEADQTPGQMVKAEAFLKKYAGKSVDDLLKQPLSDELKTLPSELWLLKALHDAGLKGYDVAVGTPEMKDGKPNQSINCVVFSRLAIQHDKTRRLPISEARPILEVWLRHKKHELVVFVNHWKSGSGNKEQEAVRVENGTVLRKRIDEISAARPDVDMVLAGDFNSDYNQSTRYKFETTGINTALRSSGNEAMAAKSGAGFVYNLWYELPPAARKSDAYREEWGTLMHLMVNGRLYDQNGFQYVDNSFTVGAFEGFNTLSWSGTPKRWSFSKGGNGFSDHFPLSLTLRYTGTSDTASKLTLTNPSTEELAVQPNKVEYKLPAAADYYAVSELADLENRRHFQYQMFKLETVVSPEFDVTINGEKFPLFSQAFDFKAALADAVSAGTPVTMYARLTQFRGKWQFTLDSPVFIVK